MPADLLQLSREELIAVIVRLEVRIVELEAWLGMNSANSHKPPSSDGPVKPAPKSLRGKSGRKPGGQAGHPGRMLSLVDNPDETITHFPGCCRDCGAGLSDRPVTRTIRRQVFDLPAPQPMRVTEHQLIAKRCGCGTVTIGQAPAGVDAPASYGPRLKAVTVYLQFARFLSRWRAAHAVLDLDRVPTPRL